MSKAEEKALKIYPAERGHMHDRPYQREGFIVGYHQAETELIDKAIGWIGEIYNYHEIMRYSDSCEPPISELTEWFKNYMKEGGKDE